MKLAEHTNTFETNAEVKSQDFGIGDASVIIEILRNKMYEHKERTMVQEYMCNGRDANREVKSKKRIIVTVPNSFNPVFKVRDFGPGITPERMANVFIKYGSSTKRGTNGQTGGFGLGAKSAWAYTDSFTIVSVTSGKKRTYVAHIGVNNQGRLDLVSTDNTDEENGTEIQVAVKPQDISEFKHSINRACYFWTKEERPEFKGVTALDNTPEHIEGTRIGNLEIVNKQLPQFLGVDSWNDKCVLVIDGIPYPVRGKLKELKNVNEIIHLAKQPVLIYMGNGVVEVAASREAISDSELTRNSLNGIAAGLYTSFVQHLKDQFKAVKTNADWITTYRKLSCIANVDDHSQYGDYYIEHGAVKSKLFYKIKMLNVGRNTGRRAGKNSVSRDDSLNVNLDAIDRVLVLDTDESLVVQNRKILQYQEANKCGSVELITWKVVADIVDQTTKKVVSVGVTEKESKAALAKIIKDFNAVAFSTLPYTPPPKQARDTSGKIDRTKEYFTIHMFKKWDKSKRPETTTAASVMSRGDKYMYVKYDDHEKFAEEIASLIDSQWMDRYKFCSLTDKSIKLVKGCKNFVSYEEWKKNFTPTANLVKAVKGSKAKNYKVMGMLEGASVKVKCPVIKEMLKEYKPLDMNGKVPETLLKMVSSHAVQFVEQDKVLTDLINEKYSLLNVFDNNSSPSGKNIDELVHYINAKV